LRLDCAWVQDKKNQGAAESVRREDEMTMAMPFLLQIGSPSAWADGFRPSLSACGGLVMSRITFLSCTPCGRLPGLPRTPV
jgi:hypothetical protein